MFKHFKNLVENQYSSKIKVLRFDNGGEYINSQFKSFVLNMTHSIKLLVHIPLNRMVF